MKRRTFLCAAAASVATSKGATRADQGSEDRELKAFINSFMRAMNAPGLALALLPASGTGRVSTFGFSDEARTIPVIPEMMFEIGSISKSFAAIAILQLSEEKKLNLRDNVLDILPWLPVDCPLGPITVHHLLTHTSGLPNPLSIWSGDPAYRVRQLNPPGKVFYYCNAGFDMLGLIVEKLDERSYAQSIEARILEPLGMNNTRAFIGNDTLSRRVQSYMPLYDDRPYCRGGPLRRAPELVFDNAAGCVTATASDMVKYMQALANHGAGEGKRRVLNAESFALMSKPFIQAEEFGPTAKYGYGIAVDELDGHRILRHTGGMVSFASAMHVDIDSKIGAFASINAMQGYRPNTVAQFALQLMRAAAEKTTPPAAPSIPDPAAIARAADYAGSYKTSDGLESVVTAKGDRLEIAIGSRRGTLERAADDLFLCRNDDLNLFAFQFARAGKTESEKKAGRVVELFWGRHWFQGEGYSGLRQIAPLPEASAFEGYYRGDSAWNPGARVISRKGALWLDGTVQLEPVGQNEFRFGAPGEKFETARFSRLVNGKAQLLQLSGGDMWRTEE